MKYVLIGIANTPDGPVEKAIAISDDPVKLEQNLADLLRQAAHGFTNAFSGHEIRGIPEL